MLLPFVKASLLLITGVSYYLQLTPPQPPPLPSDKVYEGQFFELLGRNFVLLNKLIVLLGCCWDAIVVLIAAGILPYDVKAVCHPLSGDVNAARLLSIHPVFVIGTIIVILCSFLRFWCFYTLGEFFTFEVTIRPKHRLITDGPYSFVRHPAYTGTFGTYIGVWLIHFSAGNWNRECDGMSTAGKWIVYFFLAKSIYVVYSLASRAPVEDERLEETFGEEWKDYRSRVTNRFLPSII